MSGGAGTEGRFIMTTSMQLVQQALAEITTLGLDEAMALIGQPDVQFIDIRESAELRREGMIPGAFHAPRGLLEFWADPSCEWFQPAFEPGKRLVLFCAVGWRSALAAKALQDMGVAKVSHIGGGFEAWKRAGAAVTPAPAKGEPDGPR